MRMKGVQGAIAWMKERRLGGDCWVSSGLEGDISVDSLVLYTGDKQGNKQQTLQLLHALSADYSLSAHYHVHVTGPMVTSHRSDRIQVHV